MHHIVPGRSSSWAKNMRCLWMLVLLLGAAAPLRADSVYTDEQALVPSLRHAVVTNLVRAHVEKNHYRTRVLDNKLSQELLLRYLNTLDPNHSFFLQADVEQLTEKYQFSLDEAMKSGNLKAAFVIFKMYRERLLDRVHYVKTILSEKHDFTADEEYNYDVSKRPWPKDRATLNNLWKKRIRHEILALRLADKKPEKILETIRERYRNLNNSTMQIKADDVFELFINSYTTLFDPHTNYLSPRASEDFDISMRLSLEGIGAILIIKGEYTQVQRVVPGGPADISGQLHADDFITAVSDRDNQKMVNVVGWRLGDVVNMIRGPKGSVIHLEIISGGKIGGASRTIEIVRDQVNLEQQAVKSSILVLPESGLRIATIEVPTFYLDGEAKFRGEKNYRSATRDAKKLIEQLQGDIDGMIIDLRGNVGGALSEAIDLTGLFISKGPIVQIKNSNNMVGVSGDNNPEISYAGPLAVLVDRQSASASEIFAAAIQDYRRGVVIGERTFGKGTVQNVLPLNQTGRGNDLGTVKVTTAQYFRINGSSNQLQGVKPDIVFPTAGNESNSGERSYKNALLPESIEPLKYSAMLSPSERSPAIQKKVSQHFRSDPLLRAIIDEINFEQELASKKTVSLHEAKRRDVMQRINQHEDTIRHLMKERPLIRKISVSPPVDMPKKEPSDNNAAEKKNGAFKNKLADLILQETARVLAEYIVPSRAIENKYFPRNRISKTPQIQN